ncbi:hypothetical protein BGZ60DRAFT_501245 [Tricladium varicosporioides]|nr:hypothetical protein BGZ60DRAFT_501245 [Hymenoscyphus varicosporioides]
MIDKVKFMSSLHLAQVGAEFTSLTYAVMAHGAALSPTYAHMKDKFYLLSRRYLEQIEVGQSGGFVTIAALQTCILIALYELQQAMFIRAWGSASRAVWMAQVFELCKMDQPGVPVVGQNILPLTADNAELEERRRTFWAAFNLSYFASIGSGWTVYLLINPTEVSITTYLPSEGSSFEGLAPSVLTLNDALSLLGKGILSATHGLIVTSALYGRCLSHVKYSNRETSTEYPTYDFWMHHYHINESINHLSTASLKQIKSTNFMKESDALCFNMHIQATLICLHHAAIVRISKTSAPASPSLDSENRCVNAALEITSIMRLICHLNLAKMSLVIPWALYAALQVLVRSLQSDSRNTGNSVTTLSQTPTQQGFSPTTPPYQTPVVSTDGSNNSNTYANGINPPFTSSQVSTPSRTSLLDSVQFLLSALAAFKRSNLLAGVFEAQITQEIDGGVAVTSSRIVGRVNFPLEGMQNKEFMMQWATQK